MLLCNIWFKFKYKCIRIQLEIIWCLNLNLQAESIDNSVSETLYGSEDETITIQEDFSDDDDFILVEDLEIDNDIIQQRLSDMNKDISLS